MAIVVDVNADVGLLLVGGLSETMSGQCRA